MTDTSELMKFDILNRLSGEVQFTAEIDYNQFARQSTRIGLAVKWGVRNGANLRDANLRDADLRDADLRGADLRNAYLRGADLRGANLRDADLHGANLRVTFLRGADLRGANLRDANLRNAYLRDADLRNAYLRDANLRNAYLRGTDLGGTDIIHCGTRSDGYEFFAHIRDEKLWIQAGCQYFTAKDARRHWRETRSGTPLGEESLQLVKNAVTLAKIRGLT